jgi:hypothetical protein
MGRGWKRFEEQAIKPGFHRQICKGAVVGSEGRESAVGKASIFWKNS